MQQRNALPLRQSKLVSCSEQYCSAAAWVLNSISAKELQATRTHSKKLPPAIMEVLKFLISSVLSK